MSSETGGRLVMLNDHPVRSSHVPSSKDLPLFYRKKTGASGESDEISVGPCAARIITCIVGLIALSALVVSGAVGSSVLWRFLLRLFP
jgi:hypothetical protein